MVFPGRLSRGCARCKQRKLKCDETRPSCKRCLKYGKPCPGFPTDLVIRQEARKFEELESSSPSATKSGVPSKPHRRTSGAPFNSQAIVVQNDFVSTALGVIPSWDSEALGYFMHQYVLPQDNDCPGYLHFLPKIYLDASESSCIRVAAKASAYLSLSHYSKTKSHEIQAHIWHRQAIRGLLERLQSGQAISNETVVTMILLSIFEDIDGRGHQQINPHLNGLIHILQHSDRSLINAPFFSWVRQQLIIKSFTADSRNFDPSWTAPSANPNPHLDNFRVIAIKVNQYINLVRQSFSKIKQQNSPSSKTPPMPPSELKNLVLTAIREATSVQNEINDWIARIPQTYKWTNVCKDGKGNYFIYSSRYLACYWTNVWTTLIVLLGSIITCYDTLLSLSHSSVDLNIIMSKSKSGLEAKTVLSNIHRSIPFAMGNMDHEGNKVLEPDHRSAYGCLLVWPLAVLARCRMSDDAEVREAKAGLADISSVMGVDLAHWVLNEWDSPLSPFVR